MTATGSDASLPFLIAGGSVRGRLIRLDAAIDRILSDHDYPTAVAARLAETLALAACLAGALKYDGVFTLQSQTDGAIPLVVADVTSDGHLRGYARFDAERLSKAESRRDLHPVPRYLGAGILAFTVDQQTGVDRYQGIVELSGNTLADCAETYFRQSEQLDTAFRMSVNPPRESGSEGNHGWQVAAIMVQRMPLGPNSPILTAEQADETWRRATILMSSTKDSEFFDPSLSGETLLHRLFHADGLVLHDSRPLVAQCRCSVEKVSGTLSSFPRAEVESMKDDAGLITVTCEFCKTVYSFSDEDLDKLYAP